MDSMVIVKDKRGRPVQQLKGAPAPGFLSCRTSAGNLLNEGGHDRVSETKNAPEHFPGGDPPLSAAGSELPGLSRRGCSLPRMLVYKRASTACAIRSV